MATETQPYPVYTGATKASEKLRTLLRERHPMITTPVDTETGYFLGGYGYIMDEAEQGMEVISKEQAETWLHNRIWEAQEQIDAKVTKKLNQGQKDALVSLIYDTGRAWELAGLPALINERASAKKIKDIIKGIKAPPYFKADVMAKARKKETMWWTRTRDRWMGLGGAIVIVILIIIIAGRKKKKK